MEPKFRDVQEVGLRACAEDGCASPSHSKSRSRFGERAHQFVRAFDQCKLDTHQDCKTLPPDAEVRRHHIPIRATSLSQISYSLPDLSVVSCHHSLEQQASRYPGCVPVTHVTPKLGAIAGRWFCIPTAFGARLFRVIRHPRRGFRRAAPTSIGTYVCLACLLSTPLLF